MSVFNVFTLLGGLAMFLFGMDVMGAALEKQAGNRLKTILSKVTDNPLKSFVLGLSVTAVMQSSSATTVMVVGFVNSGLMELRQAIGMIMGSNVGTTVTAWILSLTGVEGDGFWLNLLKPTGFTPLFAFAGIILYMFVKNGKYRGLGTIFLGFSLLMTGMLTMSEAMAPLADVPEFQELFVHFRMPLLGLLAGAILTAVMQSSAAGIGILQALSLTGSVTCGIAFPIILGQNIGTCVTAMLSSIGANKSARRTAIVHLYFNIIGAILFMGIFYALNALLHFSFMDEPLTPFMIAFIHSAFNIIATVALLPFSSVLEKLAYLTIPYDSSPAKTEMLDTRLLVTPAVAVRNSHLQVCNMAEVMRSNLLRAMSLIHQWDNKISESLTEDENVVDAYEDRIGSYLLQLSTLDLSREDTRSVSVMLHAIGDFERIADHACNIRNSAQEIATKQVKLSKEAWAEIAVLESVIQDIVDKTLDAFESDDLKRAQKIEPLEQVVDDLVRSMRDRHIRRLQSGACTSSAGFVLQDMLFNYERISDHCSNIAAAMVVVSENKYEVHEYLDTLRSNSPSFDQRYERYGRRYVLPEEDKVKGQVE